MATHGREIVNCLEWSGAEPVAGAVRVDAGRSVNEGEALAYVLSASGLGHWRLDLESGRLWLSEGCMTNLGIEADPAVSSVAQLMSFVHEDDQVAWREALDRAISDTGELALEHRIVRRSGVMGWVLLRGRVCRCTAGRVVMAGIIIDITAQKAVEAERERLIAELAAERARLRALIDHMPAAVIMSEAPSGRVVLTNRSVESVFALALPARPMDTTQLFSALPAFYADGRPVKPEERPISRALRGELVQAEDYRVVRGDGIETWVRLSSAPIRDPSGKITGGVAIAANVDREKLAERALRESEGRHRQLFESPAIGIIQSRVDGTITSANDTFLRMLGYDRDDLVAGRLNWREMTPPEHVSGNDKRIEEMLTTGLLRLSEKAYLHRDGRPIPVVIGGTMLAGSRTELVTFILDISDRKRVEAERESLLRSIARSQEFERQLIGIVSHDLRNPLNTILLGTEMLTSSPGLGEHGRQNARRIRGAAERATRMIHDLLDFTRARLGAGIPIERRPVRLEAILRSLIDEVRVGHPDRAIAFRAHGDCAGAFDADRLLQVLTNLVENALKYSPPGSPVQVSLRDHGDDVILLVHNEGPPIPRELLGRIFEPLQRGEITFDPTGRSVGLGLYIVKHLVEAHGGDVEVRSSESEGTYFRVRLPRRQDSCAA